MRIVHLTTFYTGGAGIAATRLHNALLENGVDSFIGFVQDIDGVPVKNAFSVGKLSFKRRLLNFFKKLTNRVERDLRLQLNLLEIDAESVYLPFSSYNPLDHPIVRDADIIHLHWTCGMIDYPSFFRQCRKPIVWTMHDMYPLLGLYIYENDYRSNYPHTKMLNDKISQIQQDAVNGFTGTIWFTTPSSFLQEKLYNSRLLDQPQCQHIYNTIDFNEFKLGDKHHKRSLLELPKQAKILLFSCASLNNKRKGFDILIDALKLLLQKRSDFILVALGEKTPFVDEELPIIYTDVITSMGKLCDYYSAADAFILPSREDNLPNVMLEALACGLPVLGTPVGGIKEIIKHGFNGLLAKDISGNELASVIAVFLDNPILFNSTDIRAHAMDSFGHRKIVDQFLSLYSVQYNTVHHPK